MSRTAAPGAQINIDVPPPEQNEANKLSPKIIYGAAIVVGVVALFFGVCGTTGLLQAYGKIHLAASWFTQAASFMGDKGLWALAVTGTTAGAIFIPLGIYKLVKGTPKNEETPTLITPPPKGMVLLDGFSTDNLDRNQSIYNIHYDPISLQNGQWAVINIDGSYGYFLLRDTSGTLQAQEVKNLSNVPATETILTNLGYKAGFVLSETDKDTLSHYTSENFDETFVNPKYKAKINRELSKKGTFAVAGNLPMGCSTCVIRDFDNQLKCIKPRPQKDALDNADLIYKIGFKETPLSKKKK